MSRLIQLPWGTRSLGLLVLTTGQFVALVRTGSGRFTPWVWWHCPWLLNSGD